MARILLIDDDELTLDLVGRMLTEMGHTVSLALDGDQGMGAIAREPIDLLITDLLMPNKEGIETIREVRLLYPETKVIAISGGHGHGVVATNLFAASKLGADAVLVKPFSPAQLSAALKLALEGGAEPA